MTKQTPLISVVMPAYNAEPYITQAIQSVLAQTYSHWELIIIDDHSTDQTWEIIHRFHDARIKFSQNVRRLGYAENLNKCLRLAHGEFIAYLDADDIADPSRLAIQIKVFAQNPNLVICGSWASVINASGKYVRQWRYPTNCWSLCARLYLQFPFVHPSAMIRKTALLKEKVWYDKSLTPAEDYDLFFRLCRHGEVQNCNVCLLNYRIHQQNTSQLHGNEYRASLPKLLYRELSQLGIETTFAEVNNLTYFLHPRLHQEYHFIKALLFLQRVRGEVRAQHHIPNATLFWVWDLYIWKTALYHFLLKVGVIAA